MSRKLARGGIALLILGGVCAIVGLLLFLRGFFAVGMEDPFIMPWRSPALRRLVSFEGAAVGIVLLGIGSYLVKIGLGLTLVGHSESIAGWLRRLVRGERLSCPECGSPAPTSAKYCSQCGTRLQ